MIELASIRESRRIRRNSVAVEARGHAVWNSATDMLGADLEDHDAAMNIPRDYALKMVPPGAAATATADVAVRAWSLVHRIAVLVLDKMLVLDDAAIRRIVDATPLVPT